MKWQVCWYELTLAAFSARAKWVILWGFEEGEGERFRGAAVVLGLFEGSA